jgi:hypothetical protein
VGRRLSGACSRGRTSCSRRAPGWRRACAEPARRVHRSERRRRRALRARPRGAARAGRSCAACRIPARSTWQPGGLPRRPRARCVRAAAASPGADRPDGPGTPAPSRARRAARAPACALGPRPSQALPAYLRHSDVALLPFRTTSTRAGAAAEALGVSRRGASGGGDAAPEPARARGEGPVLRAGAAGSRSRRAAGSARARRSASPRARTIGPRA